MTTGNFTEAGRAYAEQACYQDENIPIAEAGYRAGWKAARTHLAAQEPTDAEVRAAKVALIQDEYRVAPGYELVMIRQMGREEEYDRRARAVLSAARTVQQDEEGRNG